MIITKPAYLMIYLRYTALVLVIALLGLELYLVAHLLIYPDEYRFGTEVGGSAFFSRERYLGYRLLTLALAISSIIVGIIYRNRWWPPLLQLAVIVLALLL